MFLTVFKKGNLHSYLRLCFVTLLIITLSPSHVSAKIGASVKRAAKRAAINKASKKTVKAQNPQAIKKSSDKVIKNWSVHFCNKCPLPNKVGASFAGGRYKQKTLGKDTVLYRTYHDPGFKLGPKPFNKNTKAMNSKTSQQVKELEFESHFSYWSRTNSKGVQAIVEKAIPSHKYGNVADKVITIRAPKNTTIYEGKVGSYEYRTPDGARVIGKVAGGGNQVVLKNVKKEWEIVSPQQ